MNPEHSGPIAYENENGELTPVGSEAQNTEFFTYEEGLSFYTGNLELVEDGVTYTEELVENDTPVTAIYEYVGES